MQFKYFETETEYNKVVDLLEQGYPGADRDVLGFIATFTNNEDDEFSLAFKTGLCYYFAVLLKNEFNRGNIMFKKLGSHIVWMDEDEAAYDSEGVYASYCEGELLPMELMDPVQLNGYKHKGFYTDREVYESQLRTLHNVLKYEEENQAPPPQIKYTRSGIIIVEKYLSGEYDDNRVSDKLGEAHLIMCDENRRYLHGETSLF